ncbi:hypothetical protein BKA69DRAFT_712852 [Paraphysoderma sedebokerense]|nr:hypothetical protein BKA69DRAFT_712852 [Paraphysoderma sedebokerense]
MPDSTEELTQTELKSQPNDRSKRTRNTSRKCSTQAKYFRSSYLTVSKDDKPDSIDPISAINIAETVTAATGQITPAKTPSPSHEQLLIKIKLPTTVSPTPLPISATRGRSLPPSPSFRTFNFPVVPHEDSVISATHSEMAAETEIKRYQFTAADSISNDFSSRPRSFPCPHTLQFSQRKSARGRKPNQIYERFGFETSEKQMGKSPDSEPVTIIYS